MRDFSHLKTAELLGLKDCVGSKISENESVIEFTDSLEPAPVEWLTKKLAAQTGNAVLKPIHHDIVVTLANRTRL